LAQPSVKSAQPRDLIAPGEIKDYGLPELSREFFDSHPTEGFSPHRMLYSLMLKPELHKQATQLMRATAQRGRDEERRIKQAASGEELAQILRDGPDPLNHDLLIERILEYTSEALPIILDDLAHLPRRAYAELAIQIIHRSGVDVRDELLALVARPVTDAYDLSLVCLLLGMLGDERALKPLWDCFHFFQERYPEETYWHGPLIGLDELAGPLEIEPAKVANLINDVESSLREAVISYEPAAVARLADALLRHRRHNIAYILHELGSGPTEVSSFIERLAQHMSRRRQSDVAPGTEEERPAQS
jgi:hypothetical protein